MAKRFVLIGPRRHRVVFRPHEEHKDLYLINNQAVSIEDARRQWRDLRRSGYLVFRAPQQDPRDEVEYSQLADIDQDWTPYDPVAAGYDGLNEEYWSAVGENADPSNHWGYESRNNESDWHEVDASISSAESDDGCIF